MAMTDFGRNKLADYFRGSDFTGLESWWMALASAADIDGITELSGAGYARQEIVTSLANFAGTQGAASTLPSSGSSHATSNNNPVDFGTAGAAWGTASYVGFMDAETDGNCWFWVPIAVPVVINNTDEFAMPAGAIQLVLGITGGLSNFFSNKLIDRMFRAQPYSPPAAWEIGYTTNAPTNSTPGTEPGSGSYVRAEFAPDFTTLSSTVEPGDTGASDAGTTGLISNNVEIVWPVPTANQGNVTHFQVFDGSGGYLFWRAFDTPKTMSTGGLAPRFDPGTMEFLLT
ncbi:hypothetical protein [Rhizobacter sp. Root1221]|uniref:phage tail fiber protein n=1 Tax=Rhizobacter sp. Root1221 TaxID=1736433 RepID=UPI000AFCCD3B|nr:hypothetical protein [Rhizobacter sp. Root1221]